jgi:hypothetical protein
MSMIKLTLLAIVIATLLAVAEAAAAPPSAGVLVPGRSLGGLRLGAAPAQVTRTWGGDYGICRNCSVLTWYFNIVPFQPEGAAVELARGHVSAVYTIWKPGAWHDRRNLHLGESAARITELYGPLATQNCGGYSALTLPSARSQTVFYVLDGKLWGFGLFGRTAPVCR